MRSPTQYPSRSKHRASSCRAAPRRVCIQASASRRDCVAPPATRAADNKLRSAELIVARTLLRTIRLIVLSIFFHNILFALIKFYTRDSPSPPQNTRWAGVDSLSCCMYARGGVCAPPSKPANSLKLHPRNLWNKHATRPRIDTIIYLQTELFRFFIDFHSFTLS